MMIKPSNPIVIAHSLMTSFAARCDSSINYHQQQSIDVSISKGFESLSGFPVSRWLSLCEGAGVTPILAAAATYCKGFKWQALLPLMKETDWSGAPLSDAFIAGQFCKPLGEIYDKSSIPIDNFLKVAQSPGTAAFLLGTHYPSLSLKDASFDEDSYDLLSCLIFFWARDGLDETKAAFLRKAMMNTHLPQSLRFWIHFAAVLRMPEFHDMRSALKELSGDDHEKTEIGETFAEALSVPTITSTEAQDLYASFDDAPYLVRLSNALRLAAFLPGQAPMIDVWAPWSIQERQSAALKRLLDGAISMNRPFVSSPAPDTADGRDASTRRLVFDPAQNRDARGWTEQAIVEAMSTQATALQQSACLWALPETGQCMGLKGAGCIVAHRLSSKRAFKACCVAENYAARVADLPFSTV